MKKGLSENLSPTVLESLSQEIFSCNKLCSNFGFWEQGRVITPRKEAGQTELKKMITFGTLNLHIWIQKLFAPYEYRVFVRQGVKNES